MTDNWSLTAGDSLLEKLGEGIESSDRLVAFLSPESVESNWVKKEIATGVIMELAEEKGLGQKFVIPAALKPCKIPWMLKDKLYANFTNKSFESACEELYRGIIDQPLGVQDVLLENGFIRVHNVTPLSTKCARIVEFGVRISPTEGFNGGVDVGITSCRKRGEWFGHPNRTTVPGMMGLMLMNVMENNNPPIFSKAFSFPNITSTSSYYWFLESDEPFEIKEGAFRNYYE